MTKTDFSEVCNVPVGLDPPSPLEQSHLWIHHCRYLGTQSVIEVTPKVAVFLTTFDLESKTS